MLVLTGTSKVCTPCADGSTYHDAAAIAADPGGGCKAGGGARLDSEYNWTRLRIQLD